MHSIKITVKNTGLVLDLFKFCGTSCLSKNMENQRIRGHQLVFFHRSCLKYFKTFQLLKIPQNYLENGKTYYHVHSCHQMYSIWLWHNIYWALLLLYYWQSHAVILEEAMCKAESLTPWSLCVSYNLEYSVISMWKLLIQFLLIHFDPCNL